MRLTDPSWPVASRASWPVSASTVTPVSPVSVAAAPAFTVRSVVAASDMVVSLAIWTALPLTSMVSPACSLRSPALPDVIDTPSLPVIDSEVHLLPVTASHAA